VVKYGTVRQSADGNITQHMRFACRTTKATDTHSEQVIVIAFPWQQWLRERAAALRLLVHCLYVALISRYLNSLNESGNYTYHHFNIPCLPGLRMTRTASNNHSSAFCEVKNRVVLVLVRRHILKA